MYESALSKDVPDELYVSWFEKKVEDTIEKFSLFKRKDKVAVALSGGKDSLSLVHLLSKKGYDVSAIMIDEGIGEESGKKRLDNAIMSCKEWKIPASVYSFDDEFGFGMKSFFLKNRKNRNACTTCGVLRRRLLEMKAKGYDALATGHNLDDGALAVLMGLFKRDINKIRSFGPVHKKTKSCFVKRVKPFYFIDEEDIIRYCRLSKIRYVEDICPYKQDSYRNSIRNVLFALESSCRESKKNLVMWAMLCINQPLEEVSGNRCSACGLPSKNMLCRACNILEFTKKSTNNLKE